MNKVAVISDIHGNLEALTAVLNDINKQKIDKIICLGDIMAKGKHFQECIELIKKSCEVVLRGNCDENFINKIDRMNYDNKISDENIKYLKNLPYCYEFYMSGKLIRLFHAHPQKIDKSIGNVDTIERLYELFLPSNNTISDLKADVVIYGHIHTPYIQKLYNRIIINTGSVGNAIDLIRNDEKDGNVKNTTVANYFILKGNYNSTDINDKISFEQVSVPYDIEKELDDNINNIDLDLYQKELRQGKYRNMEKIYDWIEKIGIDKNKI